MIATYDDGLPTPKDQVRFRLGDTDMDAPLLSDYAIEQAVFTEGSALAAASFLASGLVAQYGRQPVKISADGVTFDYTILLKTWQTLAASTTSSVGTAGGLTFVPRSDVRQLSSPDEWGC